MGFLFLLYALLCVAMHSYDQAYCVSILVSATLFTSFGYKVFYCEKNCPSLCMKMMPLYWLLLVIKPICHLPQLFVHLTILQQIY